MARVRHRSNPRPTAEQINELGLLFLDRWSITVLTLEHHCCARTSLPYA